MENPILIYTSLIIILISSVMIFAIVTLSFINFLAYLVTRYTKYKLHKNNYHIEYDKIISEGKIK